MVSSAVVVFNSARMVRFGEHIQSYVPAARGVQPAVAGKVALQAV
jgi:hypothetical protein